MVIHHTHLWWLTIHFNENTGMVNNNILTKMFATRWHHIGVMENHNINSF